MLRNKPTALTGWPFKEPVRPIAGILTAVYYIGTAPGYLACILITLTIADENISAG
jgi:tetrahydromethanopterin S-methyltransferase subunit B